VTNLSKWSSTGTVAYGVYLTKHRTILWCTYGAWPAAGRIVKFKLYNCNGVRPGIVRCPVGHRTMSDSDDKRHELCLSGHRPMLYESRHRWEATCIRRRTYCIYIDISLLMIKTSNTKVYISFEQLRMNNMQRTSAFKMFAVLSKCGFHLHHCQSQPHSFLLLLTSFFWILI